MPDISLSDQILLALLAQTDAVFIPDRDPLAHPRHAVICGRRRTMATAGLPWSSEKILPGLDETGRKQVQRALDELAARGWVATFQPNATKTLAVRLTDPGDEYARALAGLPTVATALPLVEEVRRLMTGDHVCDHLGRVWVPETDLAGIRWGDNEHRKAFVDVEEKLLPALVRHWVESNCSVQGHCYYTLGPVTPGPLPDMPDLPAASEDARREYYYRIHAELEALAIARPDCEREIGQIPMPVAGMRRASQ